MEIIVPRPVEHVIATSKGFEGFRKMAGFDFQELPARGFDLRDHGVVTLDVEKLARKTGWRWVER